MKNKIKVSAEIFRKEFSPGYCPMCIHFNESKDCCELEETNVLDINAEEIFSMQQADLEKWIAGFGTLSIQHKDYFNC